MGTWVSWWNQPVAFGHNYMDRLIMVHISKICYCKECIHKLSSNNNIRIEWLKQDQIAQNMSQGNP